jgi:hypothetical protein
MTGDQVQKWTAEERAQVRAIVERTCAAQGVPLAVPPDVAHAVAALVAGRRPGPHRPPDEVVVGEVDDHAAS